jgi:hypothetical protein
MHFKTRIVKKIDPNLPLPESTVLQKMLDTYCEARMFRCTRYGLYKEAYYKYFVSDTMGSWKNMPIKKEKCNVFEGAD